jgi:hypothetical protein
MNITYDNYLNALVEFELLFLCFLFAWNFSKRPHFYLRSILSSVVFIAASFFTASIDVGDPIASGTINYLLLFLFSASALEISFSCGIATCLFCTIASYTLRHLVYLAWQLSFYIYTDCSQSPVSGFSWIWVVLSVFWVLVFIPLVLYLYRLIKRTPSIALPSWKILILALFSVLANDVLNMFVITAPLLGDVHILEYILSAFNILSSAMILIIMFGFVSETNLQKEVTYLNQMRREEEKQYQFTKENIELVNIKCHDLRKQIRALKDTHSTISQEEIDSIENATRFYDTKSGTGNIPLDTVVQEKSLVCAKNKINFTRMIDGEKLAFMKESDVFSLFGNILDNAIESVSKIKEEDNRYINLKVHEVPGGLLIFCDNPYEGKIDFKDGLPLTSKDDDKYHGFGMKSIRYIAHCYGGTMKIDTNNGEFSLSIYFPNKPQTPEIA